MSNAGNGKERCNSLHELGGMRCSREVEHSGHCRCQTERMEGGSIMYAEWTFIGTGEFRHVGYRSIYPRNAALTKGT